jgi:hypothetical protein
MAHKNKKFRMLIRRNPKTIITIVVIVTVAIVVGAVIVANNHSSTSSESTTGESATTTPATKSNSASNKAGSSNSVSQGGIIDKNGVSSVSSPSSQWKSSSSGVITLRSPITGSTLHPGDTVSGTAKIGSVQYRLVDETVGVLAQGSLSVVNGKFAGTLQFSPRGTTGRLNIFSFDSKNGAEINRVEINLRLGL